MEKLLSIREAAKLMNVQEETIRQWLRCGKLNGLKAGRVWRVKPSAVENFLGIEPEETVMPEELELFFRNDTHREIYIYMLANIPSTGFKNNIASYIIASLGNKKITRFMRNGIDIDSIRSEINLSPDEDALIQIAGALYNGYPCDLNLLSQLNREQLMVALEAIKNRYLS